MNNDPTLSNQFCILALIDERGNKAVMKIPWDADLNEWVDVFKKLLLFQEFCPEKIQSLGIGVDND